MLSVSCTARASNRTCSSSSAPAHPADTRVFWVQPVLRPPRCLSRTHHTSRWPCVRRFDVSRGQCPLPETWGNSVVLTNAGLSPATLSLSLPRLLALSPVDDRHLVCRVASAMARDAIVAFDVPRRERQLLSGARTPYNIIVHRVLLVALGVIILCAERVQPWYTPFPEVCCRRSFVRFYKAVSRLEASSKEANSRRAPVSLGSPLSAPCSGCVRYFHFFGWAPAKSHV